VPPLRSGQSHGDDHVPVLWCEPDGSDTASWQGPTADNHGGPAEVCIRSNGAGSAAPDSASGHGSCRNPQPGGHPGCVWKFGLRATRVAHP
jgi:hypothetical protein